LKSREIAPGKSAHERTFQALNRWLSNPNAHPLPAQTAPLADDNVNEMTNIPDNV
jgi:hypothetical protein